MSKSGFEPTGSRTLSLAYTSNALTNKLFKTEKCVQEILPW